MINRLKSKKGFTLTELIVVIVIIGILAAVLIPTLTGYIRKANQSAAEQEAYSYITAYQAWEVERDNGMLNEDNDTFEEYVTAMELTVAEGATLKEYKVDEEVVGFVYEKGDFIITYTAGKLTTKKK